MSHLHYFQQSCENHLRLRARCEPLSTELPEMPILGNSAGTKREGWGIYTPTLLLLGEKALFISRSVTPGPVDFPAVVSSKTVSCWAIAVVVSFPWVRSTLVHSPPAVFTMAISKSGGHGGSHKHHHECAHHENLNDSLHILLHLLSLLIGGARTPPRQAKDRPLVATHTI